MPKFPERIADLDHATYDMGLINAARATRRHLEEEYFRSGANSEDAGKAYSSLRVPWWLEMKYETPWTLRDYCKHASERISQVLSQKHASHVDTRKDDVRRMVQHWSHEVVWDSVPLHVGYADPETDVPYSSDDILVRAREKLKWIAICRYMDIKSTEDPLWQRSKSKRMSEKMRRVVDATQPQMAAAKYLIGPEMNIKTTTGPGSEVLKEAVPYLFSVDDRNAMVMSTDLRRKFKQTLAAPGNQAPDTKGLQDMKSSLTTNIIEMWMQINPTTDKALSAMQEEGKPDVLNGTLSDVFDAYVVPHLERRDAERLRKLVPLVGYHTIGAVGMDDMEAVNRAIGTWSDIARVVSDLPSRVIDLAFIACRVALAKDAEELRVLKLQMQ